MPRTAEQCASSLHHHFEEYVNASELRVELAQQGSLFAAHLVQSALSLFTAYLSFIRYYGSFAREWKYLFHVKTLHRGHVAKSFGLKQTPDETNNHTNKEYRGTFASTARGYRSADAASKE